MPVNPYAAYKTNQNAALSPRETDARALVEAARRLTLAYQNQNDRNLADDAVDFNWELWTIFQNYAMEPEAKFPLDMRVTILELCKFIDKSVIRFYAARQENYHLLKLFAEINQNIASGLFEKIN